MATHRIIDGTIDADVAGGTPADITEIISGELSIESELIDDTAVGDTWRSRKGGLKSWSATIAIHHDPAATKQEVLKAGANVDCVFMVNNEAAAAQRTYTGTARVASEGVPVAGLDASTATRTLALVGNGALTES